MGRSFRNAPPPFGGGEELPANRVEYEAENGFSILANGDRDGHERKSMNEVGRPVQGVDHPGRPGLQSPPGRLFGHDVVVGKVVENGPHDEILARLVDFRNVVGRSFLHDVAEGKGPDAIPDHFSGLHDDRSRNPIHFRLFIHSTDHFTLDSSRFAGHSPAPFQKMQASRPLPSTSMPQRSFVEQNPWKHKPLVDTRRRLC